jgi:hypothetical protein
VFDAAKALFLDGCNEPSVADQDGGDITVIRVQTKDVHGIEAASVTSVCRPMAFVNRA